MFIMYIRIMHIVWKWVHMVGYGFVLTQDEAMWLRTILEPFSWPQTAHQIPQMAQTYLFGASAGIISQRHLNVMLCARCIRQFTWFWFISHRCQSSDACGEEYTSGETLVAHICIAEDCMARGTF